MSHGERLFEVRASYAGLSVKTIRRLVDSGEVRRRKVGRRLPIPFEDLDRHILRIKDHRRPTLPTTQQAVLPRRSIDPRGRSIPTTPEAVRARAAEIAAGLDALDGMGDEQEQRETLAALGVAIDADRLSDRKRFG